jgi:alpha-galactosidase/6-phospho-beta-glucosidase family protein
MRAVLADSDVLRGGRVWLVDFNLERAETVGRLIMRTPEFAASGCELRWTNQIDQALPGADVVSVSFPVGSLAACRLSEQACLTHGLFGSDQLSVSGAFRAVTGGTIIWDIAQRMEKHCPQAWLVDFANPVAVYSGMVNNHTTIKALGVCGGFTNHRWDLMRLLFDKDEFSDEFNVVAAGINHLSFILRGTYRGEDIYKLLDAKLADPNWEPCRIPHMPRGEPSIRHGLAKLAELRRRFGPIIFSTEGDGMTHIFFEEMRNATLKTAETWDLPRIRTWEAEIATARRQQDSDFRAHLDRDLDAAFWAQDSLQNPWFAPSHDSTALVIKALGGQRQWLAASFPNRGAVKGFPERTVLEYSMHLDQDGIHPDPDLEVPDCYYGLISALATHQTLLGDAIATRDPKLFAAALFTYPIQQNTRETKALWRELLAIHASEMPAKFQKAKEYF